MKETINKYKEIMKNKYIKSIAFFGFYALFFGFIFLLLSMPHPETNHNNDTKVTDKWDILNANYEYLYQIAIKDKTTNQNLSVTLLGKKYKTKDFFTRYIDTKQNGIVYQIDKDIYVWENSTWVLKDTFNKVSTSFDNALLDLDNIKKMIEDAKLTNTITNFDESIDEQYTYGENPTINIDITSKNNQISKIEIKAPDLYITLQYKNINQVKDFTVEGKDK